MRRPRAGSLSAALSAALTAAALAPCAPVHAATVEPVAAPAPERQHQLIRLLRNDCGSCHGMRLTGGLGPALTPAALGNKATDDLTTVILQGRPGTPMPPWQPFLTEAEARWLVERMRSGALDAP